VVEAMKCVPVGKESRIIGTVTGTPRDRVVLHTSIGSHRIVDKLSGEQLPRIC